jgi:hypothetical protein
MKPTQVHIRANRDNGTIWLTEEKPGMLRIKPLRDVTDEVMLALCADLSAQRNTREIERSIKFADGMICVIRVEMVQEPQSGDTPTD